MTIIFIVVLWIAVGVTVGIILGRRGHWRRGWVLSGLFGPISIPLAVNAARRAPVPPTVIEPGEPAAGALNVLVGVDGSACSTAAVTHVADVLKGSRHRVTLAAVLDLDTAAPHDDNFLYPGPYPEEEEARRNLAQAAQVLGGLGTTPRTVVLAGDPAAALTTYAKEQGEDLIVVGARGRGITRAVFGSCATKLADGSSVPVLIVPHATKPPGPEARHRGSAGAESTERDPSTRPVGQRAPTSRAVP